MARRPRLQYPGAVYHVMSRGNRKAAIFDDDDDRRRFFDTIAAAATRYAAVVYEACQMTNHYHLVLGTPRGNLSDIMQYVNGVYSQASNRRHRRTGHVFEGRFRSIVVQRESYLRRVSRYVVLNPFRAKLVSEACAWPWSTFRATAGLDEPPPWLHTHWIDDAFDGRTHAEAQASYRRYVNEPTPPKPRFDSSAVAYGTPAFRQTVLEEACRTRPDRILPLAWRALARPALSEVFADVQAYPHRRDDSMRAAHVAHGYNMAEIARFLGLDRSTVSKAIRRSELARQPVADRPVGQG